MFGVRPTTLARWAREGKLTAILTPGGHRRYVLSYIRELLEEAGPPPIDPTTLDAVRLYDQGWSIRQVASRLGYDYGVTRRLLEKHTTLRSRGGRPTDRF